MVGFMILFCWIALAAVFILFGKLSECNALAIIGAVMILMIAMVDNVAY